MVPWLSARHDERSVSPVVGVTLLVAIVVLLVAISGAMFFGLADDEPPAPSARLSITPNDPGCGYELVHGGGERIRGDRITVQGLEDPDALEGVTFQANDEVNVDPASDDVRIVWSAEESESDHILAEFTVDPSRPSNAWSCSAGSVMTEDGGKLKVIDGDGGTDIELPNPSNVEAIGPSKVDLTGDGIHDVPYVTGNGKLKLTNKTNETTTIATDADIAGAGIAEDKTRPAVGTWNGSDESVFFVDDNDDKIYRVAPGSSPVAILDPSNGANAVQGVADVDGDGDDELLFADGSQDLRYVDPDGSITELESPNAGSSNGIGSGSIGDFDDDGTVVVVAISGSNELKLIGASSGEGGEGTETLTSTNAKKAPVAVADIDGDGEDEVVYVGKDAGKVKYVDDVDGSRTIKFLRDGDGDKIDGSDETGIV